MSEYYIKKPCQHCPFRKDVKPFLHPDRAYEIAASASNPYNTFPCHKTTVSNDNSDDGEMLVVASSKECAGFLTMRAQENGDDYLPKGFEPSFDLVYLDAFEMEHEYREAYEQRRLSNVN